MSDLREELGSLADEVGEPVSFRQLEAARRRHEHSRRSSSIVVALAVVLGVVVFFGATYVSYKVAPVVPVAPSASSPPSGHSSRPQPGGSKDGSQTPIGTPRCSSGLVVIGNGSQLVTCSYWPSGTKLTVTFRIVGSARMKLALYPARGCTEQGCDQAPVWRGRPFSGPGETTLHIRGLRWGGRYLLLDRLHPRTARALIIPG